MKTDLARTLSVGGHHGLFTYIAQARGGVIAESLEDKKRTFFDARSRITTLEDISIYTAEGEVKLREVLLKLKDTLGDKPAPDPKKATNDELKSLFEKALPDYDRDRFYVSHMKKIAQWYNELLRHASLEFVEEEKAEAEEAEA